MFNHVSGEAIFTLELDTMYQVDAVLLIGDQWLSHVTTYYSAVTADLVGPYKILVGNSQVPDENTECIGSPYLIGDGTEN